MIHSQESTRVKSQRDKVYIAPSGNLGEKVVRAIKVYTD